MSVMRKTLDELGARVTWIAGTSMTAARHGAGTEIRSCSCAASRAPGGCGSRCSGGLEARRDVLAITLLGHYDGAPFPAGTHVGFARPVLGAPAPHGARGGVHRAARS